MSLSLISFQMIRVISSPSSSTTGFATLIFAMVLPAGVRDGARNEGTPPGAAIACSTGPGKRKACAEASVGQASLAGPQRIRAVQPFELAQHGLVRDADLAFLVRVRRRPGERLADLAFAAPETQRVIGEPPQPAHGDPRVR